jgi:hypothetical protein
MHLKAWMHFVSSGQAAVRLSQLLLIPKGAEAAKQTDICCKQFVCKHRLFAVKSEPVDVLQPTKLTSAAQSAVVHVVASAHLHRSCGQLPSAQLIPQKSLSYSVEFVVLVHVPVERGDGSTDPVLAGILTYCLNGSLSN